MNRALLCPRRRTCALAMPASVCTILWVGTLNNFLRRSGWSLATVALSSFALWLAPPSTMSSGAAASTVPTCRPHQLEVAVAWGPGAAAGNLGIPFLVVNTSRSACSLRGYPFVKFSPGSYKGRSIKVTHRGGMVFDSVRPRVVEIKSHSTASFGLNYGDAANQNDPSGTPCTSRLVFVSLPVRNGAPPATFETPVDFNFCYSNFQVSVTALQAGPTPKEG